MEGSYVIHEAKAVSQTLEGEAIVINLEKGSYYSLNATGSEMWDLIIGGQPLDQIARYISDRYGITPEEAMSEVQSFVSVLKQEDLIIPAEHPASIPVPAATKAETLFVRPSFERYDDMQEMLLADPIHDVGEAGWPVLKKEEVL